MILSFFRQVLSVAATVKSVAAFLLCFLMFASPAHALTEELEFGAALPETKKVPTSSDFQLIEWNTLVPDDWDPMAAFEGINLDSLEDNSKEADEVLKKYKEEWDKAPANTSLDNKKIRIAGFIATLDYEDTALKEFLLVPYFGACIHVPPPPANQIIHVQLKDAVKGYSSMQAVWVSGTLKVEKYSTDIGTAGYALDAVAIEPYDFSTEE